MEKQELLSKLTDDLKPAPETTLGLRARILCWLATMIIVTIVGVLASGKTIDLAMMLESPRYLIECVSILFASISAGVLALLLSSPGQKTQRFTVTAFGASIVWIASVVIAFVQQLDAFATVNDLHTGGLICSQEVLLFSIIPALVLLGLIRFGSPLHGKLIGTLLLFSAGAVGMLGLQFTCSADGPIHLMVYHVIPVVGLALIGWMLGKWLCGFEAKIKRKKNELLS